MKASRLVNKEVNKVGNKVVNIVVNDVNKVAITPPADYEYLRH